MNKIEAIKQLTELKELAQEFESIEVKDGDVQALELAIKALESETAPEVPISDEKLKWMKEIGMIELKKYESEFIPESTKEILEKEINEVKRKEKLIGIDPESYLGAEILHQSRTIIEMRSEVRELRNELRKMTIELTNRQNKNNIFQSILKRK